MKTAIDTISKILTAIDGSEPSMRAAEYAILIAGKFNAEFCVIHVERDTGFTNPYSFGIYDLETQEERKAIVHDINEETKEWFDRINASAINNNIQLSKAELVV